MMILVDIMRSIQRSRGKAKPTHILYGANLSHERLKKYLEVLLSREFIEEIEDKKSDRVFYSLTLKGQQFLSEFKKVEKLSEAFGIPI